MARQHHPIQEPGGPRWQVFRLFSATVRYRLLILLAGATVIGYGIISFFQDGSEETQAVPDIRMPVANTPLEPDRPDLIGEPRIDE